jgi:maleylacetoacetate isomerase
VEEFMKVNPMKFVPALVDGDAVIGDSYAIALVSIQNFEMQ